MSPTSRGKCTLAIEAAFQGAFERAFERAFQGAFERDFQGLRFRRPEQGACDAVPAQQYSEKTLSPPLCRNCAYRLVPAYFFVRVKKAVKKAIAQKYLPFSSAKVAHLSRSEKRLASVVDLVKDPLNRGSLTRSTTTDKECQPLRLA